MDARLRWVALALGLALLLLAACSPAEEDQAPLRPTLGTPIAWATARPAAVDSAALTPAPSLTPPPTMRPPDTFTPFVFPTVTAAPTLTPVPSETAPATLTRTPFELPTQTPAPSLTPPPPTLTEAPTLTPAATQVIAQALLATASMTPPPSFTPWVYPTTEPSATPLPSAQVCASCEQLRLRLQPGTAGAILGVLTANTPLTIVGRTEDNTWAQVVLDDGRAGWVATSYLTLNIDLSVVSVTGAAEEAAVASAAVSGVTSHARQIFLAGRARGNSAYVFTRVGDSISASPSFLNPIGLGAYQLGDYGQLGGAIRAFSGPNARGFNPFNTASLAARNGWSTESVLNPANADPGVCQAGETPLECEYRLVKPAVALIMFGTNDSGGMATSTFQANLQTIVQKSINMGVIPVLSTIPPKRYNPATDGRVDEFNQVIIATARANDVPLWNYWQAMVALPNQGLNADGVHPSTPPDGQTGVFDAGHLQYGYTVRNLTALEVLYALWQQVLYDGNDAPAATLVPGGALPPEGAPGQSEGGLVDEDCMGVPPSSLVVGGQGRVTPGLPNKLRDRPTLSATQIGAIPGEGVFSVVGGPSCADGMMWWQVSYEGKTGWTAAGTSEEDWIEPWG